MGASYTNLTLRGPERLRVVAALRARGREAYVGPTEDGCTVVFDAAAEHAADENERLAVDLSRELGCAALAVGVHDDDVFFYALCDHGRVVDTYDSAPGYFARRHLPAEGGDAALLCRLMGRPGAKPEAVEEVLREPWKRAFAFETARHAHLAGALGLPALAVGLGYDAIWDGEAEDLEDELVHLGDDEDEDPGGPAARLDEDEDDDFEYGFDDDDDDAPGLDVDDDDAALAPRPPRRSVLARFVPALLKGTREPLLALFPGADGPEVHDPRTGAVAGAEAFGEWVARTHRWLVGARAEWEAGPAILTRLRVVEEGTLSLHPDGGALTLPLALVGACAPGRGVFRVRLYHALRPGLGTPEVRPRLVPPRPGLALPMVVGRWMAALAAADVEGALSAFETLGRVRDADGAAHRGREAVRAFHRAVFALGGVALEPCTVTDDGKRCAVEFVLARRGGRTVAPRPGLLVCERSPSGLLREVRLYDDLAPPGARAP